MVDWLCLCNHFQRMKEKVFSIKIKDTPHANHTNTSVITMQNFKPKHCNCKREKVERILSVSCRKSMASLKPKRTDRNAYNENWNWNEWTTRLQAVYHTNSNSAKWKPDELNGAHHEHDERRNRTIFELFCLAKFSLLFVRSLVIACVTACTIILFMSSRQHWGEREVQQ